MAEDSDIVVWEIYLNVTWQRQKPSKLSDEGRDRRK